MDSNRFSHRHNKPEGVEMIPVSQLKPRYMIQKFNNLNQSYQPQPYLENISKPPTALIVQINSVNNNESARRSPLAKNRTKVTTIEHATLSLDPTDTNNMLRVRNLNNYMNRKEYLKDIRQQRDRGIQYAKDNINLLGEALRKTHKSRGRDNGTNIALKMDAKQPS